jgi:hypothetical protein
MDETGDGVRYNMQITTTTEDGVEHYLMLDTMLHEQDIGALHKLARSIADTAGIMDSATTTMGVEVSFSGMEGDDDEAEVEKTPAMRGKTRVKLLWEGRGSRGWLRRATMERGTPVGDERA